MAENKFVVKTVFHDENGDTLLREDYRETREKAQKLKAVSYTHLTLPTICSV